MTYEEILNKIAIKENTSKEEIEKEMASAIAFAGYNCSVRDFIFDVAKSIKKDYI